MKKCNVCLTENADVKAKCRSCYNIYMNDYMKIRYHRRRAEWIESLGGKCIDCESIENLEFDHDDASKKQYDVSKMLGGWSNAKLQLEISKCVLRCKSCHLIKTLREGDLKNVNHGGGITGKRNCRCELCNPLKKEYAKRYNKSYALQALK